MSVLIRATFARFLLLNNSLLHSKPHPYTFQLSEPPSLWMSTPCTLISASPSMQIPLRLVNLTSPPSHVGKSTSKDYYGLITVSMSPTLITFFSRFFNITTITLSQEISAKQRPSSSSAENTLGPKSVPWSRTFASLVRPACEQKRKATSLTAS